MHPPQDPPEVHLLNVLHFTPDPVPVPVGALAEAHPKVLKHEGYDLKVVGEALLEELDGDLEDGEVRALRPRPRAELRRPALFLEEREEAARPLVPYAVRNQAEGLGPVDIISVWAREEEDKLPPLLDGNDAEDALPPRIKGVSVVRRAVEGLQVRVGHAAEILPHPCLLRVEIVPPEHGELHDVGRVPLLVEVQEVLPRVGTVLGRDLLERVDVAGPEPLQGVRGLGRGAEELELPPRVLLEVLVVLRLDGVELPVGQILAKEGTAEEAREAIQRVLELVVGEHVVVHGAVHARPGVGVSGARRAERVKVGFSGILFVAEEEHVLEKVSQPLHLWRVLQLTSRHRKRCRCALRLGIRA
mmetsp:Transcript_32101/g.81753  ORF Transcript_32101/g.81753 Transcript_32101/m.81753 type:complete len:359 (+) Transcript_32101:1938-3014(+)